MNWSDVIHYATKGAPSPDQKVVKTEAEWKEILDPEVFQITRQKGTERAFSGEHCSAYDPGQYACACCGTLLFDAQEQFNSGSGWPSFTVPVANNVIGYNKDTSYGMIRVETVCNVCDAHLGHVFPDGPEPTGLRYCINSLSLIKLS